MKEHTLILKEIKQETPTISTLTLKFKTPRPDFKTGQYFSIKFKGRFRPYSIASPSNEELIQTCIKNVGECSYYLTSLKPKTELKAAGPFGIFTLKPIEEDIVFLATGSGISPIRAMIKDALRQKKQIHLLFGNKTIKETPYKKEFEQLEKQHNNFHFIPVISQETYKNKGHIQDHLNKLNLKNKQFYLCGMKSMVEEITKELLKKGIERNKINFEKYV
tara:strand:+ start:1892 stop:2548 length:657 start_codon:yes stop_codon:yes gene_type:complete